MYTLSEIWIYPIKSLGGIRLHEAQVEERGLQYDRRWMIVDPSGKFVTQRSVHEMSQLDVSFADNGFMITHRSQTGEPVYVPFTTESQQVMTVQIWDDELEALHVDATIDAQLSQWLNRDVKLVMMPNWVSRKVDPDYSQDGETVSFADGYPLLVISQSSLDDLNSRLDVPVTMRRFRPNLVVTGSEAYAEDEWKELSIGSSTFRGVKPCGRCVLTTIDPATGEAGAEPLRTLSTYRKRNNKVLFGMNLLARPGHIAVGDLVTTH